MKIDNKNYSKNTISVYLLVKYVSYISFLLLVVVLIKSTIDLIR